MTDRQPQPDATANGSTRPAIQEVALTPDLVRQIADRVYSALLRDLAIERERSRRTGLNRAQGIGRLP